MKHSLPSFLLLSGMLLLVNPLLADEADIVEDRIPAAAQSTMPPPAYPSSRSRPPGWERAEKMHQWNLEQQERMRARAEHDRVEAFNRAQEHWKRHAPAWAVQQPPPQPGLSQPDLTPRPASPPATP